MTKSELLAILAEPRGDEEVSHVKAERALIAFVNDKEISEAWEKACDVQNWWYA
jgi:hypothetical protein